MIAAPPSEAGAVNAIEAEPLPAVADSAVGASAAISGSVVIWLEALEAELVPAALVALRVKV